MLVRVDRPFLSVLPLAQQVGTVFACAALALQTFRNRYPSCRYFRSDALAWVGSDW